MSSRQETETTLRSRPWFQATTPELQQKMLGLPESCNGFLEHVASRPTDGGGVRITSLHSLLFPELAKGLIFGLFLVFNVEKINDPTVRFTYQYFCWKQGPLSGAKGVVLVRGQDGNISHVVCLRGFSFACGTDTFDCIGGFSEISEQSITKVLTTITREIKEELGLSDVALLDVIELGTMLADRGMTPNAPKLFAAIIDGAEAGKIREGEHVNPDIYEMVSGPKIVPVAHLWGKGGFLMRNTDSFFGMCIARIVALGIIKGP